MTKNIFKNWLIKILGGYTQNEYESFEVKYARLEKDLLHEVNENKKLQLGKERVYDFLTCIVDSFHNFNFYNCDEFPSRIRIIMINLRIFTNYHRNYKDTIEMLDEEEFKQLVYLIQAKLEKAINNFKITKKEFEEFNCFFSKLESKYNFPLVIFENHTMIESEH